jgi:hypothetical protein
VRPVKVGTSRTLRSRPRFPEWAIRFVAIVDTEIIDVDIFETRLHVAPAATSGSASPLRARARASMPQVTIAAESALLVAA